MPHLFMLENNSSDEELRRTRQEARAITEYLVQTASPTPVAPRRQDWKAERNVHCPCVTVPRFHAPAAYLFASASVG